MTVSKYQCTEETCLGTITLNDEGRKEVMVARQTTLSGGTMDIVYPRDHGPLKEGFKPHNCPVAQGLWPPEIDEHPLAKKLQ